MREKILLLGAYGFLGYNLSFFLKKKFNVIRQSRKLNAELTLNPNNKNKLINTIRKINPEIIVNLISCTDVNKCEKNINYTIKTNIEITENISRIALKKKIYFVFISSDQLYSLNGRNDENSVFPINFYAISKFLAEKYVLESGGCNLRVNFIGKNRKSQGLLNWAYSNLKNNKKIPGYSNIEFNPLDIKSLSKIILKVIDRRLKGNFNIGSNRKITKYKLLDVFQKKLKKKNLIKKELYYSSKNLPDRPKNMVMSNNKICKILKIKNNSIQENISRAISDFYV